jgi:hypothetical protein
MTTLSAAGGALVLFALAGACSAYEPPAGLPVRPSPDCATPLESARALVNLTPAIGERRREMIVLAALRDVGRPAVLALSAEQRPGRIVLELRPAETTAVPGQAAWRGPLPEDPAALIEIRCADGVEALITEILEVE